MIAALFLAQVDPMNLPIGSRETIEVRIGGDLRGIVAAARSKRFVYVGENHDNPEAHRWQADIVKGLVADGRNVIVGTEMYQRPKQGFLDMWSLGKLDEATFLEQSDWKGQ